MSKLGKAFGEKFERNKLNILTRTFTLGGHTFKVKVPQVGELEAIYNYQKSDTDEDVEAMYQAMIADLKDINSDDIVKTENDVIVQGRSIRETAVTKLVLQHRIVEYFKLLVPETTETLDDLTYEDIDEEFPLAIQLEFIEKINEVISPDYKETRGK